jgi:hypothetical protein
MSFSCLQFNSFVSFWTFFIFDFCGGRCLVSKSIEIIFEMSTNIHLLLLFCDRHLINWCGDGLGLEAENVPQNGAVDAFAQAFALAWKEYGDNR